MTNKAIYVLAAAIAFAGACYAVTNRYDYVGVNGRFRIDTWTGNKCDLISSCG